MNSHVPQLLLTGSAMLGVTSLDREAFTYQFYLSERARLLEPVEPINPYRPRDPLSSVDEVRRDSLRYSRGDYMRQLNHHYLITMKVDLTNRAELIVSVNVLFKRICI